MAIERPTYVEVIAEDFPQLQVDCVGDGSDYDSIRVESGGTLPSKADLDARLRTKSQERMWRAIQAERDRRTQGGVKVGTNWFHSDQPSRIQQLGLVLFGANMPPNIMWKTMTGSFVQMTPTLAVQIFQAVAISDQTIFAKAEQKKAEMLASDRPCDYDQFSGWPLIFGE